MTTRVCNVCFTDKLLEDYHNCKTFPKGKVYTCKPCAKGKTVNWNFQNPDRKKRLGLEQYQKKKKKKKKKQRIL